VRPFLSGRDYHALHHENPAFRFDADETNGRIAWRPYDSMPRIIAISNGAYTHRPDWYRNFQYDQERARGLDFAEDLASPGIFEWNLADDEATLILAAEGHEGDAVRANESAAACMKRLRAAERKRRSFPSRLFRAADAYLVQRRDGKTIVAGYPWFTDWGRDTFIALRGLCLATGRLDEAREILVQWAGAVSEGMLPNRFPDAGENPEYNAVDASLWFVVAVQEFLDAMKAKKRRLAPTDHQALCAAVSAILDGYTKGTRYGIRRDADGLLAAGEPGVQLTWMDAKVGDWVVTPRIGKQAKREARARFLAPLLQHLDDAGLGHISEVADGDSPHAPGGCYFQAWSVGEALRLDQVILAK
jgi:predicted glycogen debranching enzyme